MDAVHGWRRVVGAWCLAALASLTSSCAGAGKCDPCEVSDDCSQGDAEEGHSCFCLATVTDDGVCEDEKGRCCTRSGDRCTEQGLRSQCPHLFED